MNRRTNTEWLSALRTSGQAQEEALEDLGVVIKSGLPYALSRWLSPSDPQFNTLVDETTQETLLRVLDQLDSFEGRSQFTTWVHKIAIRIALTELRRKRWRDSSLDEIMDDEDRPAPQHLMADSTISPEATTEQTDMVSHVQRIIQDELTEKQRKALVMLFIQGISMDDTARKLKTNRNALYKLIHDARLNLKRRLALEGLPIEDILASFQ
ncbi:MAG: sigma-70 family RNA polymerase sigma factor [Anaerolineales bacterium]|nr:sigma-70 family RNA polymerase sigma factor [Anaerolineales bacterium]